jgi:hypothetical protein
LRHEEDRFRSEGHPGRCKEGRPPFLGGRNILKSEVVTDLIKRSYKLGYDIGYYGHYETLGWIRREKTQINNMAKNLGILGATTASYEKGKKRGYEMRRNRLSKSSGDNAEPEEEDIVGVDWEDRRVPSPVHVKPMVLKSPKVMSMGHILDLPKILRKRV